MAGKSANKAERLAAEPTERRAGAKGKSLESGFRAIKIKLGEGGIENDVNTARAVRSVIGPAIKLMVDYNQSLDPVVECARDGGQFAGWELTGAAGLSEDESHGQAPHS